MEKETVSVPSEGEKKDKPEEKIDTPKEEKKDKPEEKIDKDVGVKLTPREKMEMLRKKRLRGEAKPLDVKFFATEQKKDYIKDNIKKHIGGFITKLKWFGGLLMPFIMIATPFLFSPAILAGVIMFIIIGIGAAIVAGIFILGGIIAAIKAVFTYIDTVPVDGIAMWILRIFVAFTLSWGYVFRKDPGRVKIKVPRVAVQTGGVQMEVKVKDLKEIPSGP